MFACTVVDTAASPKIAIVAHRSRCRHRADVGIASFHQRSGVGLVDGGIVIIFDLLSL